MENPSTNINCLPDELLLMIFSYLRAEDLGVNVKRVCARWAELCETDVLWKNSSIVFGFHDSTNYPLSVLEKLPKLQCVYLCVCDLKILRKVAECCKNLRELCIFTLQTTVGCKEALQKLVSECTLLEELTIPDGFLVSEEMAQLVAKWTRLHTITVKMDSDKPIKLRTLADGCPSLRNLLMVPLGPVTWFYCDMKYFLKQKKNKLSILRITPFSKEGRSLFPLLELCEDSLQRLELDNISVGLSVDRSTFGSMKTLSNLRSLKISHGLIPDLVECVFMEGGLSWLLEIEIEFCEELNARIVNAICDNCPNLLKLGLKGACNLNLDDGLKYLYKCQYLEYLDVSQCRCETGAAAISNIVKCSKLKYIDMAFSGIQSEYLDPIMSLPNLRYLDILGRDSFALVFDLFPLCFKKFKTLRFSYGNHVDRRSLDIIGREMPYSWICCPEICR